MPRSAPAAAIFRIAVGELVERSTRMPPSGRFASTPPSPSATESTSGGPGSDVNTTSLASASSAGLSAQPAPPPSSCSAAARRASWTVRRIAGLQQVPRHVPSHVAGPDEPETRALSHACPSMSVGSWV